MDWFSTDKIWNISTIMTYLMFIYTVRTLTEYMYSCSLYLKRYMGETILFCNNFELPARCDSSLLNILAVVSGLYSPNDNTNPNTLIWWVIFFISLKSCCLFVLLNYISWSCDIDQALHFIHLLSPENVAK